MQLAILLSLIHRHGASLPDKRTSLYDNYVDLFFSREAEKSSLVREYRPLLVDIHRFLGWVLHTEAQIGQNNGAIEEGELRNILAEYLRSEGQDEGLAARLFTGIAERVVALVSRIEGTFEFEVQPLREYFAARHLYETAPYSPPGAEKSGTIIDRFDALARDPFWTNVTRFFAGCFSKGELPSLVEHLEDLSEEYPLSLTDHPFVLASLLLGDWVFSQAPKSLNKAVDLVSEGRGFWYLANKGAPHIALPEKCGREKLAENAMCFLRHDLPDDIAFSLAIVARFNSDQAQLRDQWFRRLIELDGHTRDYWVRLAAPLGVLHNESKESIEGLLHADSTDSAVVIALAQCGRLDVLESSESWEQMFRNMLLNGEEFDFIPAPGSVLTPVIAIHQPWILFFGIERNRAMPVSRHLMDALMASSKDRRSTSTSANLERYHQFLEAIQDALNRPGSEWAKTIQPWSDLVEHSRSNFGKGWVHTKIAVSAAGIRSPRESCTDSSDLFDDAQPLCRRARYARLRSGSIQWWSKQLQLAADESEKMLACSLLLSWASKRVTLNTLDLLDERLQSLPTACWKYLVSSIRSIKGWRDQRLLKRFAPRDLPGSVSTRLATALAMVATPDSAMEIYESLLRSYRGDDEAVLEFCQWASFRVALRDESKWRQLLEHIARCRSKQISLETIPVRRWRIPDDIAELVRRQPEDFPPVLVSMSEQAFAARANRKIRQVGDVARSERWFS